MISYINGTLVEKEEGKIVVECGGIGYEIFVSNNTLLSLPLINQPCNILTYLHVKEDGMTLYGFSSKEEKELFNKLISVNGVGPKGAITILSGMKLSDLLVVIATEDVSTLSKIKGLGRKTAERICLELKDKISVLRKVEVSFDFANSSALAEAIEALINLGMNKTEATNLAKSVAKQDSTVEEIITNVLQSMGR